MDEIVQPHVFSYIAGICAKHDCYPVQIGGYTNHIHALFLLNKKVPLVKVVEDIKSHSSGWMKKQGEAYQNFYWQNGYGGFSVNPSEIDVVIDYIKNQKEHHKKKTFEEECRAFLKKYGVEYDERYVWDRGWPCYDAVSPFQGLGQRHTIYVPALAGRANSRRPVGAFGFVQSRSRQTS